MYVSLMLASVTAPIVANVLFDVVALLSRREKVLDNATNIELSMRTGAYIGEVMLFATNTAHDELVRLVFPARYNPDAPPADTASVLRLTLHEL